MRAQYPSGRFVCMLILCMYVCVCQSHKNAYRCSAQFIVTYFPVYVEK